MNQDLNVLLSLAEKRDLYVILCLWNHLIYQHKGIYQIIHYPDKTEKYIERALKHMIIDLDRNKNLIAWDILNEPEYFWEHCDITISQEEKKLEDPII